MQNGDLRPLGLGELLDRAITLSVRRFGILAASVAPAYAAFAAVQWLLIGDIAMRASSEQPTGGEWLRVLLDLALAIPAFVFARTAVAATAHAAYLGRPISLAFAYLLAARRFWPQIVALILAVVIGSAILIAIAISVVATTIVATAGGRAGTIPILVALGIGLGLAAVLGVWLFFALELATVRIAVRANRSLALFAALRATALTRPWRSLLAALVLVLVAGGIVLVSVSLVQLIPAAAVRNAVWFALSTFESIVTEILIVAFLVVYDVDIAVRREGLDLAVALAAPSISAPRG